MADLAFLIDHIELIGVLIFIALIFTHIPYSRRSSRYKKNFNALVDDARKRNIHRIKGYPWP